MDNVDGANVLLAMNESGGGELTQMLLLMVGMAAIVYFMMIRPGQKEKQAQEAFQTSLTKVEVLRPVVGDTVDVQPSEFCHQFRDVTVGDEQGFLGEAIEVNTQSAKGLEHSVQHRLVRLSKGVQNPFIAVFAGVNKRPDGFFNRRR